MKKKYLIPLLAFSFLMLAQSGSAQVAPDLVITWKARNYTPAAYQGKALPIDQTQVDAALELIDGGRVVNISGSEIRWDLNGEFLRSGIGLKTVSFFADGSDGDQILSASFSYRGQNRRAQITIPLARPEVAITGGPDIFKALLYFFNIGSPSQAKFTWEVGGNRTEGDETLNLQSELPSGTELNLRVEAQSMIRSLEMAARNMVYTVIRQ